MNPGPELDALVAEKVLGWRWAKINPATHQNAYVRDLTVGARFLRPPTTDLTDPKGPYLPADMSEPVWSEWDAPHYSTNIVLAWEVVEKVGRLFMLRFVRGKVWEASFFDEYDYEWVVRETVDGRRRDVDPSEAPTAPHAICLAALRAVGVEVPA